MFSSVTSLPKRKIISQHGGNSSNQTMAENFEESSVLFQQDTKIVSKEVTGTIEQLDTSSTPLNIQQTIEELNESPDELISKIFRYTILKIVEDNKDDYQQIKKQIKNLLLVNKFFKANVNNYSNAINFFIKVLAGTLRLSYVEVQDNPELLYGQLKDEIINFPTLKKVMDEIIVNKKAAYDEVWELVKNDRIDTPDEKGSTPLISAARVGNLDKIVELIRLNAKIDMKDNSGNTALMCAVVSGHLEVVKFLVANKAEINMKNNLGSTALILAAFFGYLEVVKFLVKNKAKVNVQNIYGDTALIFTVASGHLEAVKFLVASNAEINVENHRGYTALNIAKRNNFDTSLNSAKRNNYRQIIEYLESMSSSPTMSTCHLM